MYGSTSRVCGGRLMASRAVCADAGEDMPERRRKKRGAPMRLGWLSGARVVETYQESGPNEQ